MSLKEKLLEGLERSLEARRAFVSGLSDGQRAETGTYETWCAKDEVAHMAYWQEQRAARLAALGRGEEPAAAPPHFEQANAECFERYCSKPWAEVEAFADLAHSQLVEAVSAMDDDRLAKPASGSEERPLWEDIIGTGYTHALMHISGYYTNQGQPLEAGRLWQEWGKLAEQLDDQPEWKGLVHYNVACGLALSGHGEQAIAELRDAFAARPGLVAWSKHDTDLQSLHGLREYRELYASEHWWRALDAGPQAEAMGDQFMRVLSWVREAVKAYTAAEWREGSVACERPAGLALHLAGSLHGYCALKPGEVLEGVDMGMDWEAAEPNTLPSQEELLSYLDWVEGALARFLAEADLESAEELFRWTGSTLLGRAAYMLRHTQHHLGEICQDLHQRGHAVPQWR